MNPYCWDGKTWRDVTDYGLSETSISFELSKVSFNFKYGSEGPAMDMLVVGGFISVDLDPVDYALTPKFGYSIIEKDKVMRRRNEMTYEEYMNKYTYARLISSKY